MSPLAMNNPEIYTRLKIGLSLVIGFIAGKLAGSSSPAHYSELFSLAFLVVVIATQGAFKLFEIWRRGRRGY